MIYKLVHLQNIDAKILIHPIYDQNKNQIGWMILSILWTVDGMILDNCLDAKQCL